MHWTRRIARGLVAVLACLACLPQPTLSATTAPANATGTPTPRLKLHPLRYQCDDGMGGDRGKTLKKVFVKPGSKRPPPSRAWVHRYVYTAIHPTQHPGNQGRLDEIMTWPKGSQPKHNCTLTKFTYTKLCVPRNGTVGEFRTKLRVKTSCGTMNVKWRIRPGKGRRRGRVVMWGRTRT